METGNIRKDRSASEGSADIQDTVAGALREDLHGQHDITALLIPESCQATARIFTREDMVLCGREWVNEVFRQLDPQVETTWHHRDADYVPAGTVLFTISGRARGLLTGERTALNFLQTLSGVATVTSQFVAKLSGSPTRLLDTRKTIPGLRAAQKYAVRCGGGHNHRLGLFDAFLIKENHISACGSITAAVKAARAIAADRPVEIEVENLAGLQEAFTAQADIVMLDNFSLADIRNAVAMPRGRIKLEVSGDVTLENIAEIGATGVDYISVGSLTKHIRAVNLSMRFQQALPGTGAIS
jgi:nicotinate-nucleotide pyrophosphorylase (carboxylating)